jgi:Zn2+/Cd2+-exporting ATPase
MQELVQKSRYKITGMDCASCAAKIETALKRIDGIGEVAVSVTNGTLTVGHGERFSVDKVERQVRGLGYGITEDGAASEHSERVNIENAHGDAEWWRNRKTLLTVFCGLALASAFVAGRVFPAMEGPAFLAALAVGLLPVAFRAINAARFGTPFSIEMLMTIAAVGAVVIGAEEEAAAVVFLFLVGEALEGIAAARARRSIRGLASLVPKSAILEVDGSSWSVDAASLKVGNVVIVRPGDRVPADGIVVEGTGEIDESPVTGESVAKAKTVGDDVFAGTINAIGVLRVRVTAAAEDNTIARVVKLVEEAQESKAPTQRFIDRFSSYYTPAVVLFAALIAVVPPLTAGEPWQEWIYKGLAVLLIGCPCALVISTPAAIAAGLSAGARRGLLIKGGAVLETMGKVTAVAFDKTGTLTEGRPRVTDVFAADGREQRLISMIAALEQGSSHPLAVALVEHARAVQAPIPPAFAASAFPGEGVGGNVGGNEIFVGAPKAASRRANLSDSIVSQIAELNAQGKTVSVALVDGEVAGYVALRDEPRTDAKEALARLRDEGIRTIMLTGDNRITAAAVAAELGIEVRAEMMPEDKQKVIRELQAAGLFVAKVGDGINDAPALAAADIGIAMGGGTDVALETGDAAALHGRVVDVPDMIDLSRTTMFNIRQNITIALGLKAVFLVTTVIGVTGLWPAILADTGATVLVTANAMRLLRWRPR